MSPGKTDRKRDRDSHQLTYISREMQQSNQSEERLLFDCTVLFCILSDIWYLVFTMVYSMS